MKGRATFWLIVQDRVAALDHPLITVDDNAECVQNNVHTVSKKSERWVGTNSSFYNQLLMRTTAPSDQRISH